MAKKQINSKRTHYEQNDSLIIIIAFQFTNIGARGGKKDFFITIIREN
jgi:hypothetical protein